MCQTLLPWSEIIVSIQKFVGKVLLDKLVVITGATSGIGYVTARKYASQGANLLCINRNPEKSEALKSEIENEFGVQCDFKIADLSSHAGSPPAGRRA